MGGYVPATPSAENLQVHLDFETATLSAGTVTKT